METTKTDNKYSAGKIYTIRSFQTDKFYIGSTIQPLHKRLRGHRYSFETQTRETTSYEIIKYDDNYIELLEEYPCENKNQLNKREGELIRLHINSCVNRYIAGRTQAEYRNEPKHREKAVQVSKDYRVANKQKVKEMMHEYNIKNRETIAVNHQKYRAEHLEAINIRAKRIINCECGSTIQNAERARHSKAKKHKDYILSLLI